MLTVPTIQEWLAECRLASEERMREAGERAARIRASSPDGMTAMERAFSKIEVAAIRRGIEVTKRQARAYIDQPHRLNHIGWALADDFHSDPRAGLRRLDRLEADEPKVAQFPINIRLANLAAARIAFRVARRFRERAVDRGFMLAAE